MFPFISRVQGMFPINFRRKWAHEDSDEAKPSKRRNMGRSILQARSRLAFDDLNDDIHRELFKYFNNGDRVLFELVNKRWGGLLRDEWKSRKALAFATPRYANSFVPMCSIESHQVSERDFLAIKSFKVRAMLIKRCTNLRILIWDRAVSKSVGTIIKVHCPNIEHIDGLNDAAFKALVGNCPNVTCVRSRKGIIQALSLNPVNFGVAETSWSMADVRNFDAFQESSEYVRTLYWPNFNIHTRPLQTLLGKLPNLEAIRSTGTHYFSTIDQLPPFENVNFHQNYDALLFRKLIEKAGKAAKTVQIYALHQNPDETIKLLSKHCPNIERLYMPISFITDKNASKFVVFTKLRCLVLNCCRMGKDAPASYLYQIITTSPKLQKVECWGASTVNSAEIITACFERATSNCTKRFELTTTIDALRTWLCSQRSGLSIEEIPANLIVNRRSMLDYFPVFNRTILNEVLNVTVNEE